MFLSDFQRTELKSAHKKCKDKRFADKVKAVLLLDKNFSAEQVAEILLLDDDTVRNYKKLFLEFGVNALLSDKNNGSAPKLSTTQLHDLEQHLGINTYNDSKKIMGWIKEKFNILYSVSGVQTLLKRMGFVYKKPVLTPSKLNFDKQITFVEEYHALKENLAPQDEIYFMDGVHPQHNSVASFGWIKKGEKKELKTNNGRQRININGALNIGKKELIFVEDERINSQTMITTLEKISIHQPEGKIYIILDNARYYHANLVKEFLIKNPRIELKFLPPYSPNLNIIERLWYILKKNVTYNQFYEKFKDFEQEIRTFFENQTWKNPKYDNFLTDNFHIIKPNFSETCFC